MRINWKDFGLMYIIALLSLIILAIIVVLLFQLTSISQILGLVIVSIILVASFAFYFWRIDWLGIAISLVINAIIIMIYGVVVWFVIKLVKRNKILEILKYYWNTIFWITYTVNSRFSPILEPHCIIISVNLFWRPQEHFCTRGLLLRYGVENLEIGIPIPR